MTGVTWPKGFLADGISCGIKKSGKPDLALVLSDRSAIAAAVFTRHQAPSPGVLLDRVLIRGKKHRAVLVNSGCANAATGADGLRDIKEIFFRREREAKAKEG